MLYNFEWDPNKALSNKRKHGVTFEEACNVFDDPAALTIFDHENSNDEDRWITLGKCKKLKTLVVVHTFHEVTNNVINIRVISARKATKYETKQYEGGEHEKRI